MDLLAKLERGFDGNLTRRHAQTMSDDEIALLGHMVGQKTIAVVRALPALSPSEAVELRARVDEVLAAYDAKMQVQYAKWDAERDAKERRRERALDFALRLLASFSVPPGMISSENLTNRATWVRAVSNYFARYLIDGADDRSLLR